MPRFYTRAEVSKHNHKDDCWLVAHGRVVDVTDLIATEPFDHCKPMLEKAGEDVSHWFLRKDGSMDLEVKTFVDPVSNLVVPYTPEGYFVHVPVIAPTTSAAAPAPDVVPWWNDSKRLVGNLTRRAIALKIVNTLTSQEDVLEVCVEDTVDDIKEKFIEYNAHARSYAWKAIVAGAIKPLNGKKTLSENGVADETEEMEMLGMDPADADNMTTVLLYFSDDLTEA